MKIVITLYWKQLIDHFLQNDKHADHISLIEKTLLSLDDNIVNTNQSEKLKNELQKN